MEIAFRMKRLLICLVPWMAMTAAAQTADAPRQVEVVYSNVGPAEAWRVGDECYIAPSVLTSWHWPYTMTGSDATIQAEGRTLKVQTKIVHDRVLFPVRAIVDQLGAICRWHGNEELDVFGEVRMVTVKDGTLSIDTTISCKPHIFSLTDPSRLVVELRGMVMNKRGTGDLPDSVQVTQEDANSVRVVYQSDNIPRLPSSTDDATRHWERRVDFKKVTVYKSGPPNPENPPPTGGQDPNPPPVRAEQGQVIAQSPVVTREDSSSLQLGIPLNVPLQSAPRWRKIDLYTFEVTLPGAQFESNYRQPQSESIEKVTFIQLDDAAVLRIKTTRPVSPQLSTTDAGILITMDKPATYTGGGSVAGKIIVIDPGHGGSDSGTVSPDRSCKEKDLTLQIATDLAQELTAAGAKVIMTRDTDIFIPLKDRPAVANNNGANLFISIHVNSNATLNSTRSGTTTYYHGHAPLGQMLGESVEHEIASTSGIPELGTLSDLTRFPRSGMAVLRYSNVPAILVETAYITCPVDRSKLCSPSFQMNLARSIVRGIKEFFSNAK
ncbi:MAG TPA: N-acetylmuramoyl-L-alanine amidase [Fimbriimonadaceae bacterium]|jgi:N-acetylmuramoyl-L-alanine amidase